MVLSMPKEHKYLLKLSEEKSKFRANFKDKKTYAINLKDLETHIPNRNG